jgi:hypothetical protein
LDVLEGKEKIEKVLEKRKNKMKESLMESEDLFGDLIVPAACWFQEGLAVF